MKSRRTFLRSFGIAVGSLAGAETTSNAQASGAAAVNMGENEKVIGTFVTLYRSIPDEPEERFAGVWKLSSGIIGATNSALAEIPQVEEVADLEDFGEPMMGLLRNISENLATVYDIHIETKYLDHAVRFTGYLPLLVQIWNIIQASLGVLDVAGTKQRFVQQVRQTKSGKDAVDKFYISLLLLLTELVFLWSGVGYRTAFGTTRRVANIGLVRLRSLLGLRAYSVLLSVVHWLVRGSVETTASYIIEKSGQVAQDFSSTDSVNFSAPSTEELSNALPKEGPSPLDSFLSTEALLFGNQVESRVESVVNSSTKSLLINQYAGTGIIKTESDDASGIDWDWW